MHLTPHQAAKLHRQVGDHARYYLRLRQRLDQLSVPPTDPLYQYVLRAHAATHAITNPAPEQSRQRLMEEKSTRTSFGRRERSDAQSRRAGKAIQYLRATASTP